MRLPAAVAVAALAFSAVGAAAPSPFEPIYPMVSPDGTHIGWVEGSTYRIWTAYDDGTNARALGQGFAANGASLAAWTQRGFVVDSNFSLFLVTPAGKRVRLGPDDDFTFSTGGERVASGSGGQPGQTGPVRVVDVRTRRTVTMGFPRVANLEPALSPDGRRVAWTASGWLWVARVGGTPHRLAANGSCPQWSPDGQSIAYLSAPDSLSVVSPSGGKPRTVLVRPGGCNVPGGPVWSPDSTRIAVGAGELTVVNVKTRRTVDVAKTIGRVAGGFAWTPDGIALYASIRPWASERNQDNCTSLWRLDAATLRGAPVVRGCR